MDMLFSQWAGRYGRYMAISTVLAWRSDPITEPEAGASQPRPARLSQVYMFSPTHTSKGWCKPNMLLAKCAGSSGHYMAISTVLVKIWSNNGTRGWSIPTKTRTRGWSIPTKTSMPLPSYMFSPIHSSKGRCKRVGDLPNEREVLAIICQLLQF